MQREYLDMAKSSAEGLLAVINDVLGFSKIEAGQLTFEQRDFVLGDTVRLLVRTLGVRARDKGIYLRSEIARDVPAMLCGDSHRLAQVLNNLIGNAIKFTATGGVTLRISRAETDLAPAPGIVALHFEVQDTGIGIPAEHHAAVFEPFKQADESTTRKFGRTRANRSFQILLAEDNRVNQRVAQAILERDGHGVTIVENGRLAVDATVHTAFDVVLMDVQMPEMSGLDATAAIRAGERARGGHVPIIAMTAHALQGDRERCLAAGMDGYVTKPLIPDAVRQALAEVGCVTFQP